MLLCLRNIELENVTIETLELEKVTVRNVELENVTVRNFELENAIVRNVELENVTVRIVELENVTVRNVELENVTVRNVELENVQILCLYRSQVWGKLETCYMKSLDVRLHHHVTSMGKTAGASFSTMSCVHRHNVQSWSCIFEHCEGSLES